MAEFHRFGISETLLEGSRIFHEQVFDTLAIGRIADLLVHTLNLPADREWKLRTALAWVTVEGIGARGEQTHPLSLECGMDKNGLVVGVAFKASPDLLRLLSDESDPAFLPSPWKELSQICDRVYVKFQSGSTRMEVIASFLSHAQNESAAGERWQIMFLRAGESSRSAREYNYIELGDVRLPERDLNVRVPEPDLLDPDSEVLIKNVTDHIQERRIRVKGKKEPQKSWLRRLLPFLKPSADRVLKREMVPPPFEKTVEKTAEEVETEIEKSTDDAPEWDQMAGVLKRAEVELPRIANELASEESRKLIQTLRYDLSQQRAQIRELMKKHAAQMRKNDFHLSNREHLHHEELKKKDEQIFQKTHALNLARDHATQLAHEIERMQAAKQQNASYETLYKRKLTQSVQLVQTLKQENQKILSEIQALKNQQAASSTSPLGGNAAELEELKNRLDEYKRVNRQLFEKVNDLEAKRTQAGQVSKIDEMKARVAQAVQVAEKHKKEAEILRARVTELENEKMRLKKAS